MANEFLCIELSIILRRNELLVVGREDEIRLGVQEPIPANGERLSWQIAFGQQVLMHLHISCCIMLLWETDFLSPIRRRLPQFRRGERNGERKWCLWKDDDEGSTTFSRVSASSSSESVWLVAWWVSEWLWRLLDENLRV